MNRSMKDVYQVRLITEEESKLQSDDCPDIDEEEVKMPKFRLGQ